MLQALAAKKKKKKNDCISGEAKVLLCSMLSLHMWDQSIYWKETQLRFSLTSETKNEAVKTSK